MRSFSSVLVLSALVLSGCEDEGTGTWTLGEARASIAPDNHVVVDIIYTNEGDGPWEGSRCVIVEWQSGGIQSRDDVRAGKPPTSPVQILEDQRWCNGGNRSLLAGDRDLFRVVSNRSRDQLAGSTIVVVAEDFKGKSSDDRVIFPSP